MATIDVNNTVQVDFEVLPANIQAKAEVVANEYICVSPAFLKFPHDNAALHTQKLTIRNKTKRFMGFRIQEPRTKYFTIFFEKYGLYGGAEETIIIKCKPFDQKMCLDAIRIHVSASNETSDVLTIPLELLPSAAWFTLPKYIVMPKASIGQIVTKTIPLPMPPAGDQPYYFFVSGARPEVISVTPTEGRLGTIGGPDRLTLTYSPREYTSLIYKMSIHFPEIEFQPYDVVVYMKCLPGGNETGKKLQNVKSVDFIRIPQKSSTIKHKRLTVKKREAEEISETPDLFSSAGVMKFLLKRGGKTSLGADSKGPTGLSSTEEQRIYKEKEKDFHDQLNKVGIQEKSHTLQHTRAFLGQDPIEAKQELLQEMRRETEHANLKYQKALGMRENEIEDLTRSKLKLTQQRPVRDIKVRLPIKEKNSQGFSVDKAGSRWPRRVILRKFIQCALTIITRKRADKRIAKLKIMIKEVKKARQKTYLDRKPEEEAAHQKAIEMINMAKQAVDNAADAEQVKYSTGTGIRKKTLNKNDRAKSISYALHEKERRKNSTFVNGNKTEFFQNQETKMSLKQNQSFIDLLEMKKSNKSLGQSLMKLPGAKKINMRTQSGIFPNRTKSAIKGLDGKSLELSTLKKISFNSTKAESFSSTRGLPE